MKIEIPITQQSEEFIRKTFKGYKEIEKIPDVINGRCIIHMYPYRDTVEEDGSLSGYIDAMFCELHIYDCNNSTVFKTKHIDALIINTISSIKIFKDLSTMVVIDGGVELHSSQAFEVCPIGYYDKYKIR